MRRPALALAVAAALTALAIVPASRLRLRTDVEAMLPEGAPAAEAYRTFLGTFGGIERVYVIVRLGEGTDSDPERLADAAEALGEALSESPEVRRVRYGLDAADEEFAARRVAPRLPLLVGDDPAAIARRLTGEAIAERVAALKDAASGPGAIFLSTVAAADPLGLAGAGRFAPRGTTAFDPVNGAMLSRDGRSALVIVTPARSEADAAGGRALLAALEAASERARRAQGADLRFEATGGPLYAAHDERALRDDLVRILGAAGLLVLLLIVVAFEGISIPAVATTVVAVGQVWCAAVIALALGNVTAVGVGFAAILLGLGDDFTIHLAARFRDAWREGLDATAAMRDAIADAGPGIATAALTTAAAFGCLGFAHLRPLRELGLAVGTGVLLLVAATFLAGAPLLLLAARFWKRGGASRSSRGFGWLVALGVRAGRAAPRATIVTSLVLSALAGAGALRLELDTDLRNLRPDDHAAARAGRALLTDFGVGLETAMIAVSGRDLDEALDRADAVARLARGSFPDAEVATPSDWLVGGQRLRRRMTALTPLDLAGAADRLAAALDGAGLDVRAFSPALDTMRSIGRGQPPEPIPRAEWPDWVADGVRDGDGGTWVAVRVRVPEGAWPGGLPAPLLAEIERAAPGAQVANAGRLGAELRTVAVRDLAAVGGLAGVLVLAIVAISYRGDRSATALTFLPVVLGTLWTAGLWGWLGRPLDLFSISVLPVMIGIGVDDGLHVLHLARRRGEDLAQAALVAGRGVVLTNLTTCAGFASLAFSQVPGLRNGGLLICTGNLFCLAATLVVLPAIAGAGPERR